MKLEKRKENRVVLSVPIQYKIYKLDQLEKDIQDQVLNQRAEIQNVSLGGLQVVSPQAFRVGDILELELEIPAKGRVRSVAKVVWSRKDDTPPDFRAGIQFIPVYEDDLRKLEDYLKSGV